MPRATSCTFAADLLAQVGDLVDEGDLGGEEGVGGVLGQLGAAPRGEQDRCAVEEQRTVDFGQHLARPFVVGADNDAVGPLEILDRRAFAQEFGVGGDGEPRRGAGFAQDALHLVAGAHRDGRLGDDDCRVPQILSDFLGHGVDEGEVRMAVAAPRGRAHRDEHRARAIQRAGKIGGERKPARRDVPDDQLFKSGLVNRHLAGIEPGDLGIVLVDADDIVPEIGKARARHEADVSRSHHCNLQDASPIHSRAGRPWGKSSGNSTRRRALHATMLQMCECPLGGLTHGGACL
jgi:hypothetical protein